MKTQISVAESPWSPGLWPPVTSRNLQRYREGFSDCDDGGSAVVILGGSV